jgi:alpha-glucosidase
VTAENWDPEWWRSGVVYQIYPRSFADSNGDGIGDLPGIIDHLDHLAHETGLGVDALWLSPIYPSPGLDGGYDVSDHTAVDPLLGTMADFERLVAEAHRRGIRVILDLVLNHTSDVHAWFVDSRSSRDNPHANWFIWRDPSGFDDDGRPKPPNNWLSFFGGSAWAWDPTRRQFYLHTFLPQQPDLNWREPAVHEAQWEVVRGWRDKGVDGFRLDVFNALLKSSTFESNPQGRRFARRPWDRQKHLFDKDQRDLAALLEEFRSILDEVPGAFSVGELFEGTTAQGAAYTRAGHLIFDFDLLARPWDAREFAEEIADREKEFGPDRWPTVVLSNHDQSRQVSRYLRHLDRHDPETHDRVAKAAAVLLLTLRGTPFLYYGEEIGLPDVKIGKAETVDPPARRASWTFPWWNRDQCRSPMPWTSEPGAGFTAGRPWLPLAPDARTRNVAAEASDPRSVMAAYCRLLALRRGLRGISDGGLRLLTMGEHDVLAYERAAEGQRLLVVVNFALRPRRWSLPTGTWRPLFDSLAVDASLESDARLSVELRLNGLQAVVLEEVAPS